jgi:S-adenosylmethionine hydrolase
MDQQTGARTAPLIALLTDFGYSDAYVGVMKGVILARCGHARLLDLTHGVAPQDVLAGALQLASAVPYCPPDTVFLAVIDPGVGSSRRPLCVRSGGRLFVGPDNGLLWPAATGCGTPEAFHLDRPEHWLPPPGATFHGRDLFAPVAAMLALGRAPEALGSPVPDPVRLELPRPAPLPDGARGEVLLVDHFGNAVTNLGPDDLHRPAPDSVTFRIGERALQGPATHYGAVPQGEPVVVLGSLGFYEIALHGGDAARKLNLRRGFPVAAETSPFTPDDKGAGTRRGERGRGAPQ